MTTDSAAGTAHRRSDATKAAILDAARERFAADGYERATIRAIAAQAGIDPAMVMRYFGNKERLFATAADFTLMLPEPSSIPRKAAGATMVRHFLERWERDETLPALLRAAVTNEAAAGRMRAIFATQLGPWVAEWSRDPDGAPRRAGLVATQMLGLALCRYVLRLPPVVQLDSGGIVAMVGPTLQRYLTAPLPPDPR